MKSIIKISFLLIIPVAAYGQKDSIQSKCRIVNITQQLQLYAGIQVPVIKNLNKVFTQQGYQKIQQNYFSLGLGSIRFKNNKVSGLRISGYSVKHDKDSITSSVRTFEEEVFLGYRYFKRKSFQIYSMIGLTSSRTSIKQTKDIPSSTSFNSYTSTIGNQLEIRNKMYAANISTHLVYVFKDRNRNDGIVGLRIGYNIPVYKFGWTMNDVKLKNGPSVNFGGYYAMLLVCFSM